MHNYEIRGMSREIIDGLNLKSKEDKALVKDILSKYWENKIAIIWSVDDILDFAKEKGKDISKKEAKDVLDNLLQHHDCTIGINWDVIDVNL